MVTRQPRGGVWRGRCPDPTHRTRYRAQSPIRTRQQRGGGCRVRMEACGQLPNMAGGEPPGGSGIGKQVHALRPRDRLLMGGRSMRIHGHRKWTVQFRNDE